MAIYSPIIIARFWSKVDVLKSEYDCWNWTASTRAGGYGKMKVGKVLKSSHRLAWEIINDEPLGDRMALHRCDNPKCCNPKHIYAGTPSDNMIDVHQRGRRSADKLTPDDVREIRKAIDQGCSPRWIAADFGVTKGQISKIRTGRTWGHVT